jgi:hypothetical protein
MQPLSGWAKGNPHLERLMAAADSAVVRHLPRQAGALNQALDQAHGLAGRAKPNRPLIVMQNWIGASENVRVRRRLKMATPDHSRLRSGQITNGSPNSGSGSGVNSRWSCTWWARDGLCRYWCQLTGAQVTAGQVRSAREPIDIWAGSASEIFIQYFLTKLTFNTNF